MFLYIYLCLLKKNTQVYVAPPPGLYHIAHVYNLDVRASILVRMRTLDVNLAMPKKLTTAFFVKPGFKEENAI